ncbi:LysR family transcriptional regulator [Cloacibacillus sp. An23]|uniref:LysR family transcriptional regulator n=1 Tax=Cloacibacillus sp. An23 TaxID=1965591 RepID=UPI001302A779|nr:LysR family transcriptional regulator [Cloacibacillus sp. An23]
MTLRHLRIFVEVVNCGKMSEAASKLYISQSSISQTIAELESYYNVKLFDRLSKRLFLTSSGRELYEMASKVILSYDEMNQYMTHITDRQELKVGATFTIGATVMTQILKRLNGTCPNVTTRVVVDRTPVLERQILHGELDAALVEGTVKSPDVVVQKLMQDELFLVCSPEHPFAGKEQVEIKELEGQDFIMREPQSKTRKIFETYLEREHVAVAEKWTCNNPETIKSAVISGYGLSVLSERYVRRELEKGTIKAVPVRDIHMVRDFSLVYHKSKYRFPAFVNFVTICSNFSEIQ